MKRVTIQVWQTPAVRPELGKPLAMYINGTFVMPPTIMELHYSYVTNDHADVGAFAPPTMRVYGHEMPPREHGIMGVQTLFEQVMPSLFVLQVFWYEHGFVAHCDHDDDLTATPNI